MSLESVLQQVAMIDRALADPAALVPSLTGQTGGSAAPVGTSSTTEGSFADALQQASGEVVGSDGTPATADQEGTALAADGTALGMADTVPGLDGATSAITALASDPVGTGGTTLTSVASASDPAGVAGAYATLPAEAAAESPTAAEGLGQRIVAIAESQVGQSEQPPGSNESPAIARYRTATAGAVAGAPWCAYFASWAAREAGDPVGSQGQGLGAVSQIWSWAQSTGRAVANGPGVVPKPGDLIVFGDEHVGIVKDVLPDGDIQTIEGNYENRVSANVRTATEATGYVEMS